MHPEMLTQNAGKTQGRSFLGTSNDAIVAWLSFAAIGLWIYIEIAGKQFTAVLTISVLAQALAFILVQLQISASGSVAGISGKSLILHALKLSCRLGTTLHLDGYLPADKSGDWIYQVGDVLSLLMVLQILFSIYVSRKDSYQAREDTIDVRTLILGASMLAVLVHPHMNDWALFDILWTIHLYIDAVAMVPQVWMISKSEGKVSGFTAHYIAAILLSNCLSGTFWYLAGGEFRTPGESTDSLNITSCCVNGAHLLQLLLLLDFGYQYLKSCFRGGCYCGTAPVYVKSKRGGVFEANSKALMAWFGFACIGVYTYHEIASKQFTVILTISVLAQALSFLLLLMQISSSGSVAGISKRALLLHVCKLACRLSTTTWLDGYLPTDKSGDWIYQACDGLSLLLVLKVLHSMHFTYKMTYQREHDSVWASCLVLAAGGLAVLFHPTLNNYAFFDIVWTVHLYVDAVSMVPQLWMISKAGGKVKGLTAHYIAATFLSNLLSGAFWFFASKELEDGSSSVNVAGLAVNGAHLVQLVLLLDFGFHYLRAYLQGARCTSASYASGGLSFDL